eukprot:1448335-Pyramimonas_sp.AAC.1
MFRAQGRCTHPEETSTFLKKRSSKVAQIYALLLELSDTRVDQVFFGGREHRRCMRSAGEGNCGRRDPQGYDGATRKRGIFGGEHRC